MSEEKRKLGDYEIIQSIYIGDKEVVFGVDKKDPYPFMVCCCDYHNPLSAAWPTEGVASDDYLEAMQIFVDRVQSQMQGSMRIAPLRAAIARSTVSEWIRRNTPICCAATPQGATTIFTATAL